MTLVLSVGVVVSKVTWTTVLPVSNPTAIAAAKDAHLCD